MFLKNKMVQLCIALALGTVVLLLPRPEGTRFEITGDPEQRVLARTGAEFVFDDNNGQKTVGYVVRALQPGQAGATAERLRQEAAQLGLEEARVSYVDGLSPTALRFLAAWPPTSRGTFPARPCGDTTARGSTSSSAPGSRWPIGRRGRATASAARSTR